MKTQISSRNKLKTKIKRHLFENHKNCKFYFKNLFTFLRISYEFLASNISIYKTELNFEVIASFFLYPSPLLCVFECDMSYITYTFQFRNIYT